MFYWRIKNTVSATLSLLLSLGILFLLALFIAGGLSVYKGERRYYLDSATSQGLCKENLSLLEIFRVRGESVYIENAEEGFAEEVIKEFNAQVLWTEEVDGVLSYYCYSPRLREGVMIGGRKVNLHIARSKQVCVLGSPIIFGGF